MYLVHERFKDVFMEIMKLDDHALGDSVLSVRWWNQGFTNDPWLISTKPQKVVIKKTDWPEWREYFPGSSVHPGRV